MTIRLETTRAGRRAVSYQRRSLELSLSQWTVLENEARALGCLAVGGSKAGKPGWRSLVRRIASGELKVRWR